MSSSLLFMSQSSIAASRWNSMVRALDRRHVSMMMNRTSLPLLRVVSLIVFSMATDATMSFDAIDSLSSRSQSLTTSLLNDDDDGDDDDDDDDDDGNDDDDDDDDDTDLIHR